MIIKYHFSLPLQLILTVVYKRGVDRYRDNNLLLHDFDQDLFLFLGFDILFLPFTSNLYSHFVSMSCTPCLSLQRHLSNKKTLFYFLFLI